MSNKLCLSLMMQSSGRNKHPLSGFEQKSRGNDVVDVPRFVPSAFLLLRLCTTRRQQDRPGPAQGFILLKAGSPTSVSVKDSQANFDSL